MPSPKIVLYTNRGTWATRVHIVLREIKLEVEEVFIVLDDPRPDWYLKLNPTGQTPTLTYGDEVLRESSVITQFLTDLYPSHLVLRSIDEGGPLQRARAKFFVDLYMSDVHPHMFTACAVNDMDEKEPFADNAIAGAKKLDALLQNAGPGPFWGGSQRLTIVECMLGALLQRFLSLPRHGLLHPKLPQELPKQTPNFWRWANAVYDHPSVSEGWDEHAFAILCRRRMKERAEKAKAAAAAAAKK